MFINLKILSAVALSLLVLRPCHADSDFSKGQTLYESTLASPQRVKGWRMAGPSKVKFKNGWMHIYSSDEKSHHFFWYPRDFPDRFSAEWEMQNIEPDAELHIVFLAETAASSRLRLASRGHHDLPWVAREGLLIK